MQLPAVLLRILAVIRESPPVGFLIEDYGLIRVEQVGRLATDIADAIGLLSPFFPPISDLEGRLRALAVPDPE